MSKTTTYLLIGGAVLVALVLYLSSQGKLPKAGAAKPATNFWDSITKIAISGIGKIGGSSSSANSSPSSSPDGGIADDPIYSGDVVFTDD